MDDSAALQSTKASGEQIKDIAEEAERG